MVWYIALMLARPSLVAAAALVTSLALPACNSSAKESEAQATHNVERLSALTDADVTEVQKGLPDGAKRLIPLLSGETPPLPGRVRAEMKKVREAVTVLQLAKSTFFAVVGADGVVLASDLETDGMVGKSITTALPGVEKAKGGYTELLGEWDEARGVKTGPDAVWVAAAPIADKGLYVTGWSLRRFAHHLEEQLKTDLRHGGNKTQKAAKMPIVYAFVVRGDKAYGAPVVPEVNTKAIEGLQLSSKVKGDAAAHGQLEITNRAFGWAAKRAPKLCDTCVIALLRSEL